MSCIYARNSKERDLRTGRCPLKYRLLLLRGSDVVASDEVCFERLLCPLWLLRRCFLIDGPWRCCLHFCRGAALVPLSICDLLTLPSQTKITPSTPMQLPPSYLEVLCLREVSWKRFVVTIYDLDSCVALPRPSWPTGVAELTCMRARPLSLALVGPLWGFSSPPGASGPCWKFPLPCLSRRAVSQTDGTY